MKKKHTAPLFALAAMLLLAFAAPANAAQWTHEGEPLEEAITVGFSGSATPMQGTVGVTCGEVSGSMSLTPGDQGQITSITYKNCQGTGGASGWQLQVTPLGLPWDVEAKAEYKENSWESRFFVFTDDVSENVKYNGSNLWSQMDSTWDMLLDKPKFASKLTIQGQNEYAPSVYQGQFGVIPAGAFGIE